MKRILKHIIGTTCSLGLVLSCTKFNEQEDPNMQETGNKEKATFIAITENSEETKTYLNGVQGEQYRQILWEPGDSIRIFTTWDYYGNNFVNIETEDSFQAVFSGEIGIDNSYYAIYPSGRDTYQYDSSSGKIVFNQPNIQKYRHDSFSANSMPMAAKAPEGQELRFYALGGVLSVNLIGSETIKSLSFTGYDATGKALPVAGEFIVDLNTGEYPVMAHLPSFGLKSYSSVTLDCKRGITLNEDTATSFYFVLPIGTYTTFTVTAVTTDGKVMIRKGTNPLTIKRANVTKAGALASVEEVAIDLNEHGFANSYIVTEPGLYCFDATIIGNGYNGIIQSANFHTTNEHIHPETAELLWDSAGVINTVTLSDGKIKFVTNGQEGNALICAKDGEGNILWSWHIWVTDQPQEHTYYNSKGEFLMMDRNLGATRAGRGSNETEWYEVLGLVYQWGRKDPFAYNYYSSEWNQQTIVNSAEINQTIANPTTFYQGNYNWLNGDCDSLWTRTTKTIYDPCPVGYTVPPIDAFIGFSKTEASVYNEISNINISGTWDRGWDFIYDGTNTAYYPNANSINYNGTFYGFHYLYTSDDSEYWTCDLNESNPSRRGQNFFFYYYSNTECTLSFNEIPYRASAFPIRCMKDKGFIDRVNPITTITAINEITETGATILADIKDKGASDLIERGVVYSTTSGASIENGTKVCSNSNEVGEFTINLTELNPATRYYVKSFAINEHGIAYSSEKSFFTKFNGGSYNLSETGTANCYIVPPVYGKYEFDGSVKGNSTEPVGEIASAEILWESINNDKGIQVGDVISTVYLEGNTVCFELPFDPKQGNALIAVKDSQGTILWSWHIWVADFDPVETKQTYLNSGAVMMDRNLGAISVKPGSYESFGFFYQWGRKDPLVIGFTTAPANITEYMYDYDILIEETVANPCVVYDDATWGGNNDSSKMEEIKTYWNNIKTMYDPCPAGWRVPDQGAFKDLYRADNNQTGYFQIQQNSASPTAYIPTLGWANGLNLYDNGEYAYLWSCNIVGIRFYVWGDSATAMTAHSIDYLHSVRCMKDSAYKSGESSNDYIIDDEYIWN